MMQTDTKHLSTKYTITILDISAHPIVYRLTTNDIIYCITVGLPNSNYL